MQNLYDVISAVVKELDAEVKEIDKGQYTSYRSGKADGIDHAATVVSSRLEAWRQLNAAQIREQWKQDDERNRRNSERDY